MYTRSGSAHVQKASIGELTVAISYSHDAVKLINQGYLLENQGYLLEITNTQSGSTKTAGAAKAAGCTKHSA